MGLNCRKCRRRRRRPASKHGGEQHRNAQKVDSNIFWGIKTINSFVAQRFTETMNKHLNQPCVTTGNAHCWLVHFITLIRSQPTSRPVVMGTWSWHRVPHTHRQDSDLHGNVFSCDAGGCDALWPSRVSVAVWFLGADSLWSETRLSICLHDAATSLCHKQIYSWSSSDHRLILLSAQRHLEPLLFPRSFSLAQSSTSKQGITHISWHENMFTCEKYHTVSAVRPPWWWAACWRRSLTETSWWCVSPPSGGRRRCG